MRRAIYIITIVASILILLLSLSVASEYDFGTRVLPNDNDTGKLLKNIPDGTILSFWDIGPVLGIYDAGDVVYIDTPPIETANSNDIRLNSFSIYRAGTKVTPNDRDINAPLKPLDARICFLDLNGGQSFDLYDSVYAVQTIAAASLDSKSETPKDNNNGEINAPKTGTPIESPASASNIAETNTETSNPDTSTRPAYDDLATYYSAQGFLKRLSYTGSQEYFPRTIACLTYSDNYIWPVSDQRIDEIPILLGYDNYGYPLEVIRCQSADYYHVLGTMFVKSVSKQKKLYVQSAPVQETPSTGTNPESSGSNYAPTAETESQAAPNNIYQDSVSIRTNDIRLTNVGGLSAGTKVLNFEPDLNKLVAASVLVSFPRSSNDYAAIRVYDANGNGLYDIEDDVYMDISFPGYSSFGTVSINDIRLSGPRPVGNLQL